jgi:hypothetical protein
MQFSMLRKELKALSRFAATKDVRYYLCGVHVVQDQRGTYLEATDGHMLGRLLLSPGAKPTADIIIGNDAVAKLAASGKRGEEWLHFTVNGSSVEVIAGNEKLTFQAVDGRFPDVDRIVPTVLKDEEVAPAAFNPEYLMAFQDAANDIKGNRRGSKPCVSLLQRGNNSAIVNIDVENFLGIVMPLRDCATASIPQWCYVAKELRPETVTA